MDFGLEDLIDGTRIVKIDADSIPSPPNALAQGNYLLVNCHYSIEISGQSERTELFDTARMDVLKIAGRLAKQPIVRDFLTVNVRVVGHFPCPNMLRPAIRRIYEVSMDSRQLDCSTGKFTAGSLSTLSVFEGSQLADAPPRIEPSVAPPGL
jgi:hypothetical protein